MASTYSTSLKLELIGTGEQAGTWGSTTNTNLGTALEQAIVGKADIDMSSTTITLTLTNTNALQDARAVYLNLSGTPGGAAVLEVPAVEKPYIIKNGSDQQVTIKVSGQTGVAVPTGKTALVYNNGTDVVTSLDYIPSLVLGAALPVASGGTGSTAGDLSNCTADGTNPVGAKNIPQSGSEKTTSYTLTTGDIGKLVVVGSGGSITVPNSTFAAGDAVVIFNNTSGSITLTMSITTSYIGGVNADDNSITLLTRGVCNILFISGTVCVVTGNIQ